MGLGRADTEGGRVAAHDFAADHTHKAVVQAQFKAALRRGKDEIPDVHPAVRGHGHGAVVLKEDLGFARGAGDHALPRADRRFQDQGGAFAVGLGPGFGRDGKHHARRVPVRGSVGRG